MDMEGPLNALSASPDGSLVIAAGRDGNVIPLVTVIDRTSMPSEGMSTA